MLSKDEDHIYHILSEKVNDEPHKSCLKLGSATRMEPMMCACRAVYRPLIHAVSSEHIRAVVVVGEAAMPSSERMKHCTEAHVWFYEKQRSKYDLFHNSYNLNYHDRAGYGTAHSFLNLSIII